MDPVSGLGAIEELLDGAAVWGIELEPRFRVLGLTIEPTVQAVEKAGLTARVRGDARLQLACFPVSTILGSLRQQTTDGVVILQFTEAQLVDVVAAFDGARLPAPIFGVPEPRPGSWGPKFSLEGRSTAPDGVSATITVRLRQDDLELDLFARFDEWRLLDAAGEHLNL